MLQARKELHLGGNRDRETLRTTAPHSLRLSGGRQKCQEEPDARVRLVADCGAARTMNRAEMLERRSFRRIAPGKRRSHPLPHARWTRHVAGKGVVRNPQKSPAARGALPGGSKRERWRVLRQGHVSHREIDLADVAVAAEVSGAASQLEAGVVAANTRLTVPVLVTMAWGA